MSIENTKHDPGAETGPRQATPFTRLWYWAYLVMGIILFLGGVVDWEPSAAIADFPDLETFNPYGWNLNWNSIFHFLFGFVITVGSVFCLVGAQHRDRLDESWRYEATGALIGAAAWLSFMVVVGIARPFALIDSLFPLTAALSLIVRFKTLNHRERVFRTAYAEIRGD